MQNQGNKMAQIGPLRAQREGRLSGGIWEVECFGA